MLRALCPLQPTVEFDRDSPLVSASHSIKRCFFRPAWEGQSEESAGLGGGGATLNGEAAGWLPAGHAAAEV